MRSPSSAFDARLLRGAALLVSSLFLATCERGPTAPAVPTQLAFSVQPTPTTARFDINPGPATHLVFTVQPGNATAGATIAPAVEVTAQDASGNTVPTFTAQVTVALGGTNPSGGTLAGTKTVAAVSGVASFA